MTDLSPFRTASPRHETTRVRHELRRRTLTVARVRRLSPGMIRVTLAGPDLAGFVSAAPDDHVKLFFPPDGTGPGPGDEARPVARDYTPRRHDPAANELDIDFAIHDAGPATRWAETARPGQEIVAGGPRGSLVVPDDFDWYLLIGDETALPAIGRRLEQLREAVPVTVLAEVQGPDEHQAFTTRADLRATWCHRGGAEAGTTTLLEEALAGLDWPAGDGYVWIGCEGGVARRLRSHCLAERGHPKAWLKAAGYWSRGRADAHETIED